MSAGRKKIPTAPDILVALSGLVESGPPTPIAIPRPRGESLPASGTLPITGEVVKLPFSLGSVIAGKYEIIGLIGAGGVGYVVSAMHLELGEMVALKFLREESLAHEQVVERFSREARAAAKIKSEYVARVFDVGSLPNGVPFIVMEYLHGKDLADVVRERGKLPTKLAVEYVLQACEALASAHAVGIVHRDIKPENMFLSRQGEGVEVIKVLDFGISKVALTGAAALEGRKFAKTMMPMGTPAYMSPEQIRSTGDVDARTDIWALGCVLFELLTGHCVFDAPTLMQLGAAILERDPIPLRKIVHDAPPELEAVILRCLEKDVTKRYQNVAELAIALYPFAPRRARISVERSSHLLRSTSPTGLPLDLGSVPPPEATSSAPAPVVIQPLPPLPVLTSQPITADEVDSLRPRRKNAPLIVAAAALLVAGAAAYASFGRAPQQAAPALAPQSPAAVRAEPVSAPAQTGAPIAHPTSGTSAPGDTPSGATDATKAAATTHAPTSGTANALRGRAKPGHLLRPRAPGAPRGADDEFDVGY